MGYDTSRFTGSDLKPDVICTICLEVLEDPLEIEECQHYFCRQCITQWLETNATCPFDKHPLTPNGLKSPPRLVKVFLEDLDIRCDFQPEGCQAMVKLGQLVNHVKDCLFSPEGVLSCDSNCGYTFKRKDRGAHCCLSYLKGVNHDLEEKQGLLAKVSELRREIDALKDEVDVLKQKRQGHEVAATRSHGEGHSSGIKRKSTEPSTSMETRRTSIDRVKLIMDSINYKTFFTNKPFPKKSAEFHFAKWAPYLSEGMNVLYDVKCVGIASHAAYEWVFLAQMVGPTGQITVVGGNEATIEVVRLNHEELITSSTIKFVNSEPIDGYPEGAPYDFIRDNGSFGHVLRNQLDGEGVHASGDTIYDMTQDLE